MSKKLSIAPPFKAGINKQVIIYPSWRPSYYQELLLKSALLKGDLALNSWKEWKTNVDIDKIDRYSHRLLSLLYKNLKEIGFEDSLTDRLQGVYKKSWYKNQLFFFHLSQILPKFHDQGIETLLLKGTALSLLYYEDNGVRAMEDIDLLVPYDKVKAAIALLEKLKFNIETKHPIDDFFLRLVHGTSLRNDKGIIIDLHWSHLKRTIITDDEASAWMNAVPVQLNNIISLALNPEGMLLHVCEHALSWRGAVNIRWVADAMTILNKADVEIDWNRFVALVHQYRLKPFIKEMLIYLKQAFDAPLPDNLINKLDKYDLSPNEESYYKCLIKYYNTNNISGEIPKRLLRLYWSLYFMFMHTPAKDRYFPKSLLLIMKFFQVSFNIKYLWLVPVFVPYNSMKRLVLITGKYFKRILWRDHH